MIGFAETRAAACTIFSPMPPAPKMAIDWPIFSWALLLITPKPVVTAQPKRAASVGIEVAGDRRHAVLGNDRHLVERRDPAGVDGADLGLVDGRGRFQARAFPPVEHDLVVGLDRADAFADFQHDAGPLVAQQVRQEAIGPFDAVDLADLRAADAAGEDFDQHLAHGRPGHFDFLQHQRGLLLDQDCRERFHNGFLNVLITLRVMLTSERVVHYSK